MAVDTTTEIRLAMTGNKKNKSSSVANWFLSKLIKDGLHEEFLGDLEEIYQDRVTTKGAFYAQLTYWFDVLHLLIGFSSLNPFKNTSLTMYKHYLRVAHRNLIRNTINSFINILSLAVGNDC